MSAPAPRPTYTADMARRDRERRERERDKLAAAYDAAADALETFATADHRDAVTLLRREAEYWRRPR